MSEPVRIPAEWFTTPWRVPYGRNVHRAYTQEDDRSPGAVYSVLACDLTRVHWDFDPSERIQPDGTDCTCARCCKALGLQEEKAS